MGGKKGDDGGAPAGAVLLAMDEGKKERQWGSRMSEWQAPHREDGETQG